MKFRFESCHFSFAIESTIQNYQKEKGQFPINLRKPAEEKFQFLHQVKKEKP